MELIRQAAALLNLISYWWQPPEDKEEIAGVTARDDICGSGWCYGGGTMTGMDWWPPPCFDPNFPVFPEAVFDCSSHDLDLQRQYDDGGGVTRRCSNTVSDPDFNRAVKLTADERRTKIHRYINKRNHRNFAKKIKYACRKALADSRPRVRGRFAKNDEFERIECDTDDDDGGIAAGAHRAETGVPGGGAAAMDPRFLPQQFCNH